MTTQITGVQYRLATLPGLVTFGLALAAIPDALPAQAQHAPPPAPRTAFEVASVRRPPPGACCASWTTGYPSNRFTASDIPLAFVISLAFGVDSNRISGGPDWLGSQNYDISAKADGDQGLTREQMQPLLQRLLEERFHLTTHRERKQVSGYALVAAKGGPKLQASKGGQTLINILPEAIIARGVPVKTFAAVLSTPVGSPVMDATGIAGSYDFKLEYSPSEAIDSSLPSIFTALEEQLGLRLESRKVAVEMLVVDHVDRVPTED